MSVDKKVTRQVSIGEQGIALIHKRVTEMGYLFHPRRVDHGIDGHIDLVDRRTGRILNLVLLVQSKASTLPFSRENEASFQYKCSESDLSYWLSGNAPVVLILSHPDRDEAWWVDIRAEMADPERRASRTVFIDKRRQIFDVSAASALLQCAASEDSHARWFGATGDRAPEEPEHGWIVTGQGGRFHFSTRASGQRNRGRGGDLFCGRTAALAVVRGWLSAPSAPGRPLVVTGEPGSGKSAVVARTVQAMDEEGEGPGLAFHARGATHTELLAAVADLVGHADPAGTDDLVEVLADAGDAIVWRVVVDALDEAHSRADRAQMAHALVELAALPCMRVVVATRPRAAGDRFTSAGLLPGLGVPSPCSANLVDLDSPAFFNPEDVLDYAAAVLSQHRVPRPGPPAAAWRSYGADAALCHRLASVIATRAGHNFLVAALAAHHLSIAEKAVDLLGQDFDAAMIPATVGEALTKYLDDLGEQDRYLVRGRLVALAYTRGGGVNDELWKRFADALGYPTTAADLDQIRDSAAADLVHSSIARPGSGVSGLYHQALADELLAGRHDRLADEAALLNALLPDSPADWATASSYARRHAVDHAVGAGRLDELILDGHYLAVADLSRLMSMLPSHSSSATAPVIAVLRQATEAHLLPASRRSRLLALSAAHLGLPELQRNLAAPILDRFAPQWAHGLGTAHQVLVGHTGEGVSVAMGRAGDDDVVVTGGADGLVQVFDAVSGTLIDELDEHPGGVHAVAIARLGRRDVIATTGADGVLRLTDAATGEVLHELPASTCEGHSVLALGSVGDEDVVVSSGVAGICFHDVNTGQVIRRIGHEYGVEAVELAQACGRDVIASSAEDGIARLFDAMTGELVVELPGHAGWINGVSLGHLGDQDVAVTSGGDGIVRICDAGSGALLRCISDWPMASTVARVDGRDLVLTGNIDGSIRVYDASTGDLVSEFRGHTDAVVTLAHAEVEGRNLVVSGGLDAMVRVHEIFSATTSGDPLTGHDAKVTAVAIGRVDNREVVIAAAADDAVRIFDAATGRSIGPPLDGFRSSMQIATGDLAGRQTIACGGFGGALHLIDVQTRQVVQDISNASWACVISLAFGRVADHDVIAVGANDGTARVLNAATGAQLCGISTRADAIAVGHAGGNDILVTVRYDGAARIFNATTGALIHDLSDRVGPCWAAATGALNGRDVVVLGCSDGAASVVDPLTGQVMQRLTGHTRAIHAVTIGQVEGRPVVVTGSLDATVRVIDPEAGTSVVLDVVDVVNAVAASAGGSLFIASGCAVISIARVAEGGAAGS